MNRSTEIKVGITVVAGVVMLLAGIAWLGRWATRANTKDWVVRFDQSGGLQDGAEVQVNGIRGGLVQGIKLQGNTVIVGMGLREDIVLTTSERVSIRNVGLMGEKVLYVTYRGAGSPISTRDTISGLFEKGLGEVVGEMGTSTAAFNSLAAQLDTIAAAMSRNGGVGRTVEDFQKTATLMHTMVEENRSALHTTISNFAATSTTTRELVTSREEQLKAAMDDFAKAADNFERLSTRLDSLRVSMQSVVSKVDNGDGTMGRLVNDQKLYAEMHSSVQEIKRLIEDVKANPRKYFKFSVF